MSDEQGKFDTFHRVVRDSECGTVVIDSVTDIGDSMEEIVENIKYVHSLGKTLIIENLNMATMKADVYKEMIEESFGNFEESETIIEGLDIPIDIPENS